MRIDILTIFPDFFASLEVSLLGKAQESGKINIAVHDLRDWASDKHRTVDDSPYGGGAGMVMRADVWDSAFASVLSAPGSISTEKKPVLLVPTPSGKPFTQTMAEELSEENRIIFACGRYEGIDTRFIDLAESRHDVRVVEFSLGDYVLNGGESATLVAIEAIGRLVPEVVGNSYSLVEESHGESGLLEYPVYTRPSCFGGVEVPAVLRAGDHQAVERWRHDKSLERTVVRRPDLLLPGGKAHSSLSVRDILFCYSRGLWPLAGELKVEVLPANDRQMQQFPGVRIRTLLTGLNGEQIERCWEFLLSISGNEDKKTYLALPLAVAGEFTSFSQASLVLGTTEKETRRILQSLDAISVLHLRKYLVKEGQLDLEENPQLYICGQLEDPSVLLALLEAGIPFASNKAKRKLHRSLSALGMTRAAGIKIAVLSKELS
ncbi:tRNA (guanosine(37)-N1)-methyltransferase TrmD [Actinomycetaceae bacterium TAE3-ERU4]|nr:tRNA (guanosine(37)-N1)-methyltransferase TrmD [Actinomycetaceae bacterium TAE3-ERU4]